MVSGIKQLFNMLAYSTDEKENRRRDVTAIQNSLSDGKLIKRHKKRTLVRRDLKFFDLLTERFELFGSRYNGIQEPEILSTCFNNGGNTRQSSTTSDDIVVISCKIASHSTEPQNTLCANKNENATALTSIPVSSQSLEAFNAHFKEKIPVISSCENIALRPVQCIPLAKRRCLRSWNQDVTKKLSDETVCGNKTSFALRNVTSLLDKDYAKEYVSSDEEGGVDHWSNEQPDRNGFYKVERLLAKKIAFDSTSKAKEKKTVYYYIKWTGWTHYFDSWEPERNLGHITFVMSEFEAREEALACVVKNSNVRVKDERLRQLRNLDRWESQMNAKLKEARMKKLYVYNDVNEALRPKNFEYITKNKLPIILENRIKTSEAHFCYCEPGMCGKTSCCPAREGHRLFYTKQGYLRQEYSKDQGKIVECNQRCKCDAKCPTKVLQRGRRHLVAIVQTKMCGWGVFALEDIPRNRFVVEYVGEVLSVDEARKRKDPYYQFEIGEEGEVSYVIDAKNFGNESAFINHSCDPNLVAIPIYAERMIPGYHRIGFFTITDVKRGEELTLDYFNNPSEEENYIRDEDGIKCHCGAACCKGYFPQVMNDDGSPRKPGTDDSKSAQKHTVVRSLMGEEI